MSDSSKEPTDGELLRLAAARDEGIAVRDLVAAFDLPRRTAQTRLARLLSAGSLQRIGAGRSTRYVPPARRTPFLPLTEAALDVQAQVARPLTTRTPVGYERRFLDRYRPNESAYLDPGVRASLATLGRRGTTQEAGTYAREIYDRLLIDLSWASSRLEGNTYSWLDTEALLTAGREADGKELFETQMILNHKDAIEFLIDNARTATFDRFTVQSLHGLLSNNLLRNPASEGRLRTISVRIGRSVFLPLDVPQLIDEGFQQVLDTGRAIADPIEQAFFALVHLPYLQPFDDVNKCVSRLAANIPLIRDNLCPLSFLDVPVDLYVQGILGIYELNRVELLRDVFVWAYRRSCQQYDAIQRSLGEPDPFRLRHRLLIRRVVGDIVRDILPGSETPTRINTVLHELPPEDHARFREVVHEEIEALHIGNIARYRLRPSDLERWQEVRHR